MMYAIYSWYGGWNRLFQYPATKYVDVAERMLRTVREKHPDGKFQIRPVEQTFLTIKL